TRDSRPASICRIYRMDHSRRNLRRADFSFLRSTLGIAAMLVNPFRLSAQDNYEIQVYGSETVAVGKTMVELHSNLTLDGRKQAENGVLPSDHAFHETLEITHGFTPRFETGFYLFSSARAGDGWQWVGDHIRPRIRVPDEWHWPVGVSLSAEIDYQQRKLSEDTRSVEH